MKNCLRSGSPAERVFLRTAFPGDNEPFSRDGIQMDRICGAASYAWPSLWLINEIGSARFPTAPCASPDRRGGRFRPTLFLRIKLPQPPPLKGKNSLSLRTILPGTLEQGLTERRTIQDAFGPLEGGVPDLWYATLIQSDYNDTPLQRNQLFSNTPGNLECIVVKGDDRSLWHFYRDSFSGRWYNSTYPRPITSDAGNGVADGRLAHPGAAGAPGMTGGDIRTHIGFGSSNGWHANFEVVVPTPFNTLAHYYRDNQNGEKWYATEEFGAGTSGTNVTLLHDEELQSLEVVVSGNAAGLEHYRRDAGGGNWTFTRSFAPNNGAGAAGFTLDPSSLHRFSNGR